MAWDQLFERMTEQGASDLHPTSEHIPMIRDSGDLAGALVRPAIEGQTS